ncbi:ImmA/IrrE family metallo-endopeptidase [Micromonospora sp. WMMA1363]|uniref:ImmA/IrrE family metallo-endopeptidase n=1 Tax=Micromonospora sp. WMMA1363 TaxID=3053985 RepID=UPI00259CC1EA|nr:ImmA/IrrE family metallo-endopeptidase [Micromonospora sp. WMMA1363]MDM4723333.1 ImmA/IrrE family metallo-endopeptidase [Micromonospora sp. WMMA1363]
MRKIQRLIRQLDVDLPTPLTVQGVVSALETARDRRIQVVAMTIDEPTGPCGLWVATPETDYVLYSREASPVLQVQTILHELMHIALKHTGRTLLSGVDRLSGSLNPTEAQVLLARSTSAFVDERQERDAELLATYLGARLDGGNHIGVFDDLGDDTAAVMYRIAAALAD